MLLYEVQHQLDLEALILWYVDHFDGLALYVLLLSTSDVSQVPIKEESDKILLYYFTLPDGHPFVVIQVNSGFCRQKLEAVK